MCAACLYHSTDELRIPIGQKFKTEAVEDRTVYSCCNVSEDAKRLKSTRSLAKKIIVTDQCGIRGIKLWDRRLWENNRLWVGNGGSASSRHLIGD